MPEHRQIEIRNLKWPHRPTSVATAPFLGEDEFGHWIGQTKGDPWRTADGTRTGVFLSSFVIVIPPNACWTACFNTADPVIDVDIVLPVNWNGDVLEVVDLELDVLRTADGRVQIRDRDEFERTRTAWAMPDHIAAQAETACEQLRDWVERGIEPFGSVGHAWLARFLTETDRPPHRS
ncbi:MAG: DUF402 domain-containing protein [Thermomicrobiales bacterium]